MCGRYNLYHSRQDLVEHFHLVEGIVELNPRYNVAPTQPMPVVLPTQDAGDGWTLEIMRWGLIPGWAKDASVGSRMINARGETLREKPAFRSAVRRRRCLVPASGFYEWRKTGSRKQPLHVRRRDGRPLALAGLWEEWRDAEARPVRTFTIVTTGANRLMAPIHDRMPVILDGDGAARWLDPATDLECACALLGPCPDEVLEAYPVDPAVGRPAFDSAACIEPLKSSPTLF
jgi:putative SOS response-associated peptidase YedK